MNEFVDVIEPVIAAATYPGTWISEELRRCASICTRFDAAKWIVSCSL